MPTSRKKMALLNGLDQYSAYYSVICVFGSVVGCVVVPLITQSIECIILSAIVISLTAKTIHSRSLAFKDDQQDDRRRGVTRDIGANDKKMKKKKLQSSVSLEGSKKKQTEDHTYRSSSLSPHNRSSNNNHSPQPTRTRQIVAVNPLAPSECVTTATSLNTTTCTATAALPKMMGSNWNAQLYYWSLHQAGLTRPIQYGWDPVAPPHNYGSRPLGRNLQLQQLQPGSSLWGQRGVFPAPATSVSSSSPAPPICSSFGAIGNLSTAPVPADSSSRQQQQRQLSQESAEREKIDSDGRGYSLFSGNGQTIFGGSLLNGQVSSGSGQPVSMTNGGNCTNEGGSPMKMRFDEWPAF